MEIKNKKVFLRADFNVPVCDGKIKNDFRIISTLETMRYLRDNACKTIIVSHIESNDKCIGLNTLKPVYEYFLENLKEFDIKFIDNLENLENIKNTLDSIKEGGFVLLENIRNLKEEKENDINTAQIFKDMVDVYINDASAVSHRNHMSVSSIPSLVSKENKMFGFQMKKEIDNLSKLFNPNRPLSVILSGAKFKTKLPLIKKYLDNADNLLIGGALYNNILYSLGYNIGLSLMDTDEETINYVNDLVKTDLFSNKVFVIDSFVVKKHNNQVVLRKIDNIEEGESIQDIDEDYVYQYIKKINEYKSKTIVWNGPLGNYEDIRFSKGTLCMAKELLKYVEDNKDVFLCIGGGDIVSVVEKLHMENERIFISTGGGAMLEFLEKEGDIPGVISVL